MKKYAVKNTLLSLIVFSVLPVINFIFKNTLSFTFNMEYLIIYPLYVLCDSIYLTQKFGFKFWIILSSACVFLIPTVLFYSVWISPGLLYLAIYIVLSVIGVGLGLLFKNLKKTS